MDLCCTHICLLLNSVLGNLDGAFEMGYVFYFCWENMLLQSIYVMLLFIDILVAFGTVQ